MTRGADRQDVFVDDVDRLFIESLIGEAVERFATQIHAYALMTNHLHLLGHCPDGDLSALIQHVLGRYASFFNDRHQRSGPLFGGRFRSVAVESDDQLAIVGRYIHRNPLDLTGLRSLAAYRWSSYGVHLGRRRAPDWLTVGALVGSSPSEVEAYRRFVETPLASDTTGHAGVAESLARYPEIILSVIAELCGIESHELTIGRRGAENRPRLLAAQLMVELRSAPSEHVAPILGFDSASSLRNAARRARILAASDPAFDQLRSRALQRLWQDDAA